METAFATVTEGINELRLRGYHSDWNLELLLGHQSQIVDVGYLNQNLSADE